MRNTFDDSTTVALASAVFTPVWIVTIFIGYDQWIWAAATFAVASAGWLLIPATRGMFGQLPFHFAAAVTFLMITLTYLQRLELNRDIDHSLGKWLYALSSGTGALVLAKLVMKYRQQLAAQDTPAQ